MWAPTPFAPVSKIAMARRLQMLESPRGGGVADAAYPAARGAFTYLRREFSETASNRVRAMREQGRRSHAQALLQLHRNVRRNLHCTRTPAIELAALADRHLLRRTSNEPDREALERAWRSVARVRGRSIFLVGDSSQLGRHRQICRGAVFAGPESGCYPSNACLFRFCMTKLFRVAWPRLPFCSRRRMWRAGGQITDIPGREVWHTSGAPRGNRYLLRESVEMTQGDRSSTLISASISAANS